MLPETTERVSQSTADRINDEIRQKTIGNIRSYASCGPEGIERRLGELKSEWDIERMIEANAAALAFAGTCLGALVNRKWFLLPAAVTAFLAQHAFQGWCPPVPVLRRLGVRTADEIEKERFALKSLRGDFGDIDGDVNKAIQAAEL